VGITVKCVLSKGSLAETVLSKDSRKHIWQRKHTCFWVGAVGRTAVLANLEPGLTYLCALKDLGARLVGISKESEAKLQQAVDGGGYHVEAAPFDLGMFAFLFMGLPSFPWYFSYRGVVVKRTSHSLVGMAGRVRCDLYCQEKELI
jgi:hypothetical protein